jgi:hypothetical protein
VNTVAKFYLKSVEIHGPSVGVVHLGASTRGATNASWAAATPSGEIRMQINNPSAFAAFLKLMEAGKRELFVTFETDEVSDQPHPFERFVRDGHWQNNMCAVCGSREDAPLHAPR